MATWAIDLDGVVWRGSTLIDGADRAVQLLLDHGHEVVFCTNHAESPRVKQEALASLGVAACPVLTSAEAASSQCTPGDRVLLLGDRSMAEVLEERDLEVVDVFALVDGAAVPSVDAVIVGASSRWDRSRVGMTADAVRAGARFLATNDDPTYPVRGPDGPRLLPGNGALVAAVSVAAGRTPEVTGKPHAVMASLLVDLYGPIDFVVGDKPETDGQLAARVGARFGLVLSGVTESSDLPVEPMPSVVAPDLLALVESASLD